MQLNTNSTTSFLIIIGILANFNLLAQNGKVGLNSLYDNELSKTDSSFYFINEIDRGYYYSRQADFVFSADNEKSGIYAKMAYLIGEKHDDYWLMIDAHIRMGNVVSYLNPGGTSRKIFKDFDALDHYDEAQKLLNKEFDAYLQSQLYAGQGYYYYYHKDYDLALTVSQRHISHLEKYGMVDDTPVAIIANIHAMNGDVQKAKHYFSLQAEAFIKKGKPQNVATTMNDIGNMYYNLNQFDSALYYYLEGVKIGEQYGESIFLSFLKDNIGLVYKELKDYPTSINWFMKALAHRKEVKWEAGLVVTMNHLGEVYLLYNLPLSAVTILSECLPIARKINNLEYLEITTKLLSQSFIKVNVVDSAFHYLNWTNDILNERLKKESEQALRASINAIEFENERLKNDLTRSNYQIALVLILCILLVAILIAGYLFGLNRKNGYIALIEKAEKEAETAKRLTQEAENRARIQKMKHEKDILEASVNAMSSDLLNYSHVVAMKNDSLRTLETKLVQTVKSNEGQIHEKEINEIVKLAKRSISDTDNWLPFFENFDRVNSNFYTTLRNKFPDLTINDLRLCAYHHLNFTSSEISTIMNISMASLRNSRLRLRKKLNIDGHQDIEQFIIGIVQDQST